MLWAVKKWHDEKKESNNCTLSVQKSLGLVILRFQLLMSVLKYFFWFTVNGNDLLFFSRGKLCIQFVMKKFSGKCNLPSEMNKD